MAGSPPPPPNPVHAVSQTIGRPTGLPTPQQQNGHSNLSLLPPWHTRYISSMPCSHLLFQRREDPSTNHPPSYQRPHLPRQNIKLPTRTHSRNTLSHPRERHTPTPKPHRPTHLSPQPHHTDKHKHKHTANMEGYHELLFHQPKYTKVLEDIQ